METTFWYKARYWIFLLLICIIIVAFHPMIIERGKIANLQSGNVLSPYISGLFMLLFALCINFRTMLKSNVVRHVCVILGAIGLSYFFVFALFDNSSMLSDMRAIAMCVIAIVIGWQLNLDEKKLNVFYLVFAILSLSIGIMQVTISVGGFRILDHYHVEGKNTFGVLMSASVLILFFIAINSSKRKAVKIVYYGLAVLGIVVLLTIRARAAAGTSVIIILYVLYQRYKGQDFIFYLLLFLFLSVVVYLVLPSSAKQYVIASFIQHQEDDITSGRTTRNMIGINFFLRNFWYGNLGVGDYIEWIHNYIIDKLCRFGIVFSLPLLWMYFYLLITTIHHSLKCNSRNIYNIGYFALLIPFVVSLVEPTMPFGPGTGTIPIFIMFGISLRNTFRVKRIEKK